MRAKSDQDSRLMTRMAAADAAAFEELYRKYILFVIAYVMRSKGSSAMVEDLVQEVFARLWQNRRQFRGESRPKAYILGIAKNVMADRQKRLAKQNAAVLPQVPKPVSTQQEGPYAEDSQINRVEIREFVENAILKLSAKEREAIRACYFEGLSSHEAMAKRASCALEAFRGRLRRAEKRLRQLWKNTEF